MNIGAIVLKGAFSGAIFALALGTLVNILDFVIRGMKKRN